MRASSAFACVLGLVAILGTPTPARSLAATSDTQAVDVDPQIYQRLRALDPTRISARDVSEVLARVPAPRIILLQGSGLGPVTMEPFGEFLIAMGYPADKVRSPRDGRLSQSSYMDSQRLAGMIAWYYENEGLRPVLIGHSQGGMLVVRVLYEFAGDFSGSIHVWNPITDQAEQRTTIVDPSTGEVRPVVGLRLRYAAAIATGKLPRLLSGQWAMIPRLRRIPDTVEDFTGYTLEWDFIAGDFPGTEPYTAIGTASVRNVTLPGNYSHMGLPLTEHLAANAVTRAWIDAYIPGATAAVPANRDIDTSNLIHAADIWYSVKRNWCLSAQRRLEATRMTQ